jgi:hypothetical protein
MHNLPLSPFLSQQEQKANLPPILLPYKKKKQKETLLQLIKGLSGDRLQIY